MAQLWLHELTEAIQFLSQRFSAMLALGMAMWVSQELNNSCMDCHEIFYLHDPQQMNPTDFRTKPPDG